MILTALLLVAAKQPYSFDASFIECCSCKDVCSAELTGKDAGCHGFGAIQFRSGSYAGKKLKGSAAFAFDSGKWVRIYVDAPKETKGAVTAFMKTALADWGKLEAVHSATVRMSYLGLMVDKGHTASLKLHCETSFDGMSPVTYNNLASPLHSTLMHGKVVGASFSGPHPFKLAKTNGFFNERYTMKGKI